MDLKYGTKIKMHSTEPFADIVGYVVGKSTVDQPVLGAGYIIASQNLSKPGLGFIDEVHYPYTHFVAFECQFDVIVD
jgi:hypothetical protein